MRRLLTLCLLSVLLIPQAFAITKTPHLVAYFPLMGDALDHSGAGITTTVSGAVPAAGKIGGAYDFDGASSIYPLLTPAVTSINAANQITVAAWVYNRSTTYPNTYHMEWGTGSTYLAVRNNAQVFLSLTMTVAGAGAQVTQGGATAPIPNTWVHVAGTWDGSRIRVYVNGVLDATSTSVAGTLNLPTGTYSIGKWGVGYEWDGLIQHVAIYKTALSQHDIKRLMLGLTPLNG